MSVALELPPVIEQEVRYCANARGISFVQFLFELVEKEAARIRAERSRRVKPNVSDFIGYGLKFDDTPMTTAEYMAEMREGAYRRCHDRCVCAFKGRTNNSKRV